MQRQFAKEQDGTLLDLKVRLPEDIADLDQIAQRVGTPIHHLMRSRLGRRVWRVAAKLDQILGQHN